MIPPAPSYRSLLKPALATAAVSLLAFGLAHVAFITWAADRSEDTSLLLRLGIMLGAPMMIGAVPAAIGALVAALVWQRTWGTPLASWRWGPLFATALLPAILLNLALGPTGDAEPAPWVMPALLASIVLLPALLGAWRARSPWGLGVGVAALPVAAMLSMFIQAEALTGWVLPFVVSTLAIFAASGWLMTRMLARFAPEAFSSGALSASS